MAIITPEELTAYMGGVELNPEEMSIVETVIIPGVQQELELFLNKPLEPVQIRESIAVDEHGFIVFSVTPVWKIIQVMHSDGTLIPGSPYVPPPMVPDPSVERRVDMSGLGQVALPFRYHIGAFGLTVPMSWWYGGVAPYVIAEYIGGNIHYTDQAVKTAVLRVCAREVERQFDDTASLNQGNIEPTQESDPRRKGWMPEELERFRRLRRRVIR